MSKRPITIETIYQAGKPDGNKMIRLTLSSMTTYVVQRSLLKVASEMKGIDRHGVYYLINQDENNRIAQIYVGQTRNGIYRLEEHNRKKDFWNKAILFLADNKVFDYNMINWLESYCIKKVFESNRYEVINKNSPNVDIDEFEMANVERVYDEIQFVMATLGYKMESSSDIVDEGIEIFHTNRNNIVAYGVYNGEKFQVLDNSEIDMSREVRIPKYNTQRQELIDSDKLVLEDGKYILKAVLEFNTPSGASDFVLGGSTNGWTEWKNNEGRTLDEIYRK